jgi:protein-tyrosine phosphatase
MHPDIRAYLVQRGIDPSQHRQRKVSAELLRVTDLAIAMSTDHQTFLFETFQHRAPLFNDVCHGRSEPLLDVWEAVPTWENDHDAARNYVFHTMEYIWASVPGLLENLGAYLQTDTSGGPSVGERSPDVTRGAEHMGYSAEASILRRRERGEGADHA